MAQIHSAAAPFRTQRYAMKSRYSAHQLAKVIERANVPAASDREGPRSHRHEGWVFVSHYAHTDTTNQQFSLVAFFPTWDHFERIISPEGDVYSFPPSAEFTTSMDDNEAGLWHVLSHWRVHMEMRHVVCAANRRDGKIYCAPRHKHPLMHAVMGGDIKGCEPGFVDQFGFFLDCQEAWEIAERVGQIKYRVSTDGTLHSENLY